MSGGSIERLSAGVAEDDRIARAAAGDDLYPGGDWVVKDLGYEGLCAFEPGGGSDCEDTDVTRQMSRFSPARSLRQVEAIRKVIAEYRRYDGRQTSEIGDVGYDEYVCGYHRATGLADGRTDEP